MTRRIALALAAALAALIVIVVAYWLFSGSAADDLTGPTEATLEPETPVPTGEAILYFPGQRDKLYAERRALSVELEGEAKIRRVVTELLRGPDSEELYPVLPSELEIGGVSLDANGILFLDLSSKAGSLRGMGSTSEMLAVYSLVNTVLVNQPEARAVVLLWNGRQQPSLAGHVDTTRPLTANRRLIAESS
jgi:hypothetical protein